jgi:hypothetical protein
VFGGGRRRAAAAAEAAHEAERRALFAQLAQRPAHICPFLGLAYERTGYVDGPSIEHRCFAFGDPAPLSTEQQTRVCQEKGYGQCPRYLRGLLVTPTEELQALRNPQAAMAALPPLPRLPSERPAPVPVPPERRRRRILVAGLLVLLLLVILGGAGAAYLLLRGDGVAIGPTETPESSATAVPGTIGPNATAEPTPTATAAPPGTQLDSPTPEPTPSAGDRFAFYEVSVGPGSNLLFEIDDDGNVGEQRRATFDNFSFARVAPIEGTDGEVYWRTEEGGLAGLAYRYPESSEFGIRAVFIGDDGSRRSVFLEEEDLTRFPEATPAP